MDNARTQSEKEDLAEMRRPFADRYWEQADIPAVEAAEHWDVDGRYWTRRVFWEGGDQSVVGSFSVEFLPDSVEILDHWMS
jgi:hypothetical protein